MPDPMTLNMFSVGMYNHEQTTLSVRSHPSTSRGHPPSESQSGTRSSRRPSYVPSRPSSTSDTNQWSGLDPLSSLPEPELGRMTKRVAIKAAQTLFAINVLTKNSFPNDKTKQKWANQCFGQAYMETVLRMYFLNDRLPLIYHLITLKYQLHHHNQDNNNTKVLSSQHYQKSANNQ